MQKLIIIGGGPAGYSAAIRARQLDYEVTLIEKDKLGGTCLNRGCIPTKTILHSSDVFHQISKNDIEIKFDNLSFDINKMFERKNSVVSKLNKGVDMLIDANQIEYYNSKAKLKNSSSVELDNNKIIKGDKIILALGASPSKIPVEGIEHALTSDDILDKKFDKYKDVVIIGGGVIGVEFAWLFSDLGCKVTIIEALDTILTPMGKDISKYVALNLRKKGVKIAVKSKVKKIVKTPDGFLTEYEDRKQNFISSDIVINATGRIPQNIEGLENTKAIYDKGFVVDENNRTPDKNIYATGDCVKGNIQLAHYAAAEGMRIVEKLAGKVTTPLKNTPACIYTNPQAALVGKSQGECDFQIDVGRFNIASMGKSLSQGGQNGFIKVVFDKQSARLIGAEMVCGGASEMAGFISNLINKGVTRDEILSTVYPHPSYSEGFVEACQDSINCSIHTIYKK